MSSTPNYSRLDAALAQACDETPADDRALTVFIHTLEPPTAEQSQRLANLGVNLPASPRRILTATLSPVQVAALSNEPWVKYLKLSQRLKMAEK
jgi:hypothetical protein